MAALGITGVIVGFAMGGTALSQADSARNPPPTAGTPPGLVFGCVDTRCTSSAYQGLVSAHDLAVAADIALVAGASLTVVGALLAILLGDGGGGSSTRASAACDTHGCQAVVQGQF